MLHADLSECTSGDDQANAVRVFLMLIAASQIRHLDLHVDPELTVLFSSGTRRNVNVTNVESIRVLVVDGYCDMAPFNDACVLRLRGSSLAAWSEIAIDVTRPQKVVISYVDSYSGLHVRLVI